jgi:hypothetical protein
MSTYEVLCLAAASLYGMFVIIGLVEIIKKRLRK